MAFEQFIILRIDLLKANTLNHSFLPATCDYNMLPHALPAHLHFNAQSVQTYAYTQTHVCMYVCEVACVQVY